MPQIIKPLKVLCTLGLQSSIEAALAAFVTRIPQFEARYESTNALMAGIATGESADVAVLIDTAIDKLIHEGKVATNSRSDLARAKVGLAVRAGAHKPDISSPEALRHTLLNAHSIAYTESGASGIHFAHVIEHLGIAKEIRAKATIQDGVVGKLAAAGDVEIAVQQISELKLADGVDIVGPLPEPLQKQTIFSAGIFLTSKKPDAARAFIDALAGPEIAATFRDKGLEPLVTFV